MPSPSNRPVTMQMIAKQAGVSVMTVSLALRNNNSISVATRDKIHRIASSLGYRPNPLVSALMGQIRKGRVTTQTTRIGYLSLVSDEILSSISIHRNYYNGAKNRCEELGYTLEKFTLADETLFGKRISQILHTRNIRGVIVGPLKHTSQMFELDWESFSCALIGNTITHPRLHRAASHQYQVAKTLMDKLHQLGYTRPGLVLTHNESIRVNDQYLAAFKAANCRYSPERDYPLLFEERFDPQKIYHWFLREQPDVLIYSWGDNFYKSFIKRYGIRVPEDVAYVNVGYTLAIPHIAGVLENSVAVGASAADLVIAQLTQNERGIPKMPKTVLISGNWVDAPSCPDRGQRSSQAN